MKCGIVSRVTLHDKIQFINEYLLQLVTHRHKTYHFKSTLKCVYRPN